MSMKGEVLPKATLPSCAYYPIKSTTEFYPAGTIGLARTAIEGIGEKGDVVLLKNHGLIAGGKDIDTAMTCAEYTEEAAEISYLAKLVGYDDFISEKDALYLKRAIKGDDNL